MAKKSTKKASTNAVRQGEKPSYGKPPVEHQFKPGQSGNPKGPPKHRTNMWPWFCKYMEMTDTQIGKLDQAKLTQVQQTALMLVEKVKAGEKVGSTRMARYAIDRDEGRAVERVIIGEDSPLTDERCEELARLLRGAWGEGQEARHDADSNP